MDDKRKFYNIALASIRESQSILILAEMEECEAEIILDQSAACIYKLIQVLR